jgi:RNA polymerase sigma-70 factor (ECF subfamily)
VLEESGRELSDAELLRRAAEGDRSGFDALVQRHQGAVFRFARMLSRQDADAEEVLQETFLAAWRGAARFRGESAVLTWLLAIARRAVLRQTRRRVGEPAEFDSLEALGSAAGWGDPRAGGLPRLDDRLELERALSTLAASDREVLVLRDVEGLSTSEAARVLGVEDAALRARLHRARLRLAARLRGGSDREG